MREDEILLLEEPLFCCLLPLTLRLTGQGCATATCGELKSAHVRCRVQSRSKIARGLFAVTLLIQVTGTFRGQRVRGAHCVTLKLPCADRGTEITCAIVPRSLRSACVCHADGTECEACLLVQICVVSPCPEEARTCTDDKLRRIKRVLRAPAKPSHCPACEEIRRACPPLPPKQCDP